MLKPMQKNLLLLLFVLVLGAGCTKSARLNRHLKRADAAWQKGDMEAARLEYLNVLKLAPDQPEVLSRLGILFFDRGEIVSAARLLTRARELQPTNIPVRLKLGAIFLAVGRFTNAVEEGEYVLAHSPSNGEAAVLLANSSPRTELASLEQRLQSLVAANASVADLHLALGIARNRLGKDAEAESSFKKAHELDAKNSKPALALGNLYWSQSKTNEAAVFLKTASELAPARSVERLRFAEYQLRHGHPEEGRQLLEEAVAKAPDFLLARTSLAEIYLLERRTNECAAQVEAVLKIDPRNSAALLVRSRMKQATGNPEGAMEDLEQITRADPNNQAALYELALLYRQRNDLSRAFGTIERALSVRTNFVQGILLRSELLASSGDFAAAIPPLIQLTNQAPKNPAPYFLLASALRARGSPEDALAVYRRMNQLFPDDPQPHQYAAITFRQQKKFAQARAEYTRALQVQTNYLPAIDDLIELDILATNYTAALDRAQSYITLYPDKPMPRLLQAKVYVAEKKWPEAEASLKKAVEAAPDFYLAHRSLATLYITSQQTGPAIEKLKNLIATNPKDAGSMLQLGMMYEATTNYPAARETYEKLLQIQPNSTYALNNLAYLVSEQFQDNDKAWELAQRARSQNPNDPFLADTYGWIAFRRGDYARALPALQSAAERLGDKPEVNFHVGMAYYMSGQREQAVAALSDAVKSKDEFNGKDQAASALAVLQIDPASSRPADKKLLDEALARNPSDLFALVRLAQIQERDKEWSRAAATYKSALKASPKSAGILLQLASLQMEHLNQKSEALAAAREAWTISQDPASARAIGPIAVAAGDSKWAFPILQVAARSPGADPATFFYLALAAYNQADLKSAAESLERALNATQSFPEKNQVPPFLALVKFHQGAGGVEQAAEAVKTLLQSNPQFTPALVGQGLVLEAEQKTSEARRQYEAVLKLDPDHLLAQRQLAILLAEKFPEDNAAASLAAKVRAQLPDDPVIAKTLGKIAYRRGNYREAAPLLASAAARMPKNADILYHLGLAEFHLKQRSARNSLNAALALDPAGKLAPEARKALGELK